MIISCLFLNDLGGNLGKFGVSWFEIGSFLGGDVASDLILLLFLGMSFSGVILAPIAPVAPEKTDRSDQSFSTTIYSGAGGSDWIIKGGAFFTFFVSIDSLGNVFSRNWCHKFLLCFFLLITWWFWIFGCFFIITCYIFSLFFNELLRIKGLT